MLTLVEFFFHIFCLCSYVEIHLVKPNNYTRQKNNGQFCESILVCVNLNQFITRSSIGGNE